MAAPLDYFADVGADGSSACSDIRYLVLSREPSFFRGSLSDISLSEKLHLGVAPAGSEILGVADGSNNRGLLVRLS